MPTTTIIEEFNFGIYAIATRTDEDAVELDDLSAEEARTLLELFTSGFVGHENSFRVQHISGMNLEIGSGNAKSDLYIVPSTQSGQGKYLVRLEPSIVPVVVPASSPSSSRVDEIYLVVTDGNYEGGNLYLPRLVYRQGDAGQSAPGPAGSWNSYVLLSTIPVSAAATSPGSLTDRRSRAGIVGGVGGAIPVGGIIMWSGSIANIPAGWRLCDGSGGTPNLRDRFIVGAGSTYNVGNTGGANTVTLTTSQMPSHSHGRGTITAGSSGSSHVHEGFTFIGRASGIEEISFKDIAGDSAGNATLYRVGEAVKGRRATGSIDWPGGSSHRVTGVRTHGSGHGHGISGSTASVGSSNSHENRPPYYALAFIQRVE